MIHEYAVSPKLFEATHGIHFLRALLGEFGPEQGRLISEYPRRKWIQLAQYCLKRVAGDDDIKRNQLSLLLTKLQGRGALYERQGAGWDEQKTWLNNAIAEHERRAFRGIFFHDSANVTPGVLTPENYLEATEWKNPSTVSVSRTAYAMVQAALPLFSLSRTLVLMDRNFDPREQRFSKVLAEFGRLIQAQGHQPRISQIKYVTTYEGGWNQPCTRERFEKECRESLPARLPKGVSVKFLIKAKARCEHDRFVLTERGGLQFGHGLDEGQGEVLITRLAHDVFQKKWDDWGLGTCDTFEIKSDQG